MRSISLILVVKKPSTWSIAKARFGLGSDNLWVQSAATFWLRYQ
jgi:hypothetical protein